MKPRSRATKRRARRSNESETTRSERGNRSLGSSRRLFVVAVGVAVVIAVAVYVTKAPSSRSAEPLVDIFDHLKTHGFVPNTSLGGRFRPGDVLQVMQPNPGGPQTAPQRLSMPILALRAKECFPGLEPARAAFPLPDVARATEASLGIEGARLAEVFPGLAIAESAARSYRLTFDQPEVLSFAKLDLSGTFAMSCAEKVRRALAAGDRLEWFVTVVEVVEAQGLTLEVTWRSGTDGNLRASIENQAVKALDDLSGAPGTKAPEPHSPDGSIALGVRVAARDDRTMVLRVDTPVLLGYRARPIEPAGVSPVHAGTHLRRTTGVVDAQASVDDLRGMFVRQDPEVFVGRLALRVQQSDGTWARVPSDHEFRSGDRFRFEVESNREASLFVFHQPAAGTRTELWPASTGHANHISAQKSIEVPPPPAAFAMDGATGAEVFYVALADPSLFPSENRIDDPENFVLRGLPELATRGVGIKYDADSWLYFRQTAHSVYMAAVAFQLRHSP